MHKQSTSEQIKNQQRAWAKNHKNGYAIKLECNLFKPLTIEAEYEFGTGKGNELKIENGRCKMQALHSSSALVYNFFEYWRERNISFIAEAFGASKGMTEMQFERTHAIFRGGTPPHLDIEFRGDSMIPFAIESKFTEPFGRKTKYDISDAYFRYPEIWKELPECRELLKGIYSEKKSGFTYLDAPQLIKHILGLNKCFGSKSYKLLYLWYYVPSEEANTHKKQIDEFSQLVRDEAYFRSMTYQELFERIKQYPNISEDYLKYIEYIGGRYFPEL